MNTLFDLLTPFDHWWAYALTYFGVVWVVATALMRYGPRQCPRDTLERETAYDHGQGKDVTTKSVRKMTRTECKDNGHFHHVMLRDYALIYALLWPVILIVAPFVGIGAAYVVSMAYLGRPKWVEDVQHDKIEMHRIKHKQIGA